MLALKSHVMKPILKITTTALAILLTGSQCICQGGVVKRAYEEDEKYSVLDGAYLPENNARKYIEYPHLREADVMYKKRVWQVIDLNQKFNQPFYYPQDRIKNRMNLIRLIVDEGLRSEESDVIAYRPGANQDDEFTDPILSVAELDEILKVEKTKKIYDENDEYIGDETTLVDIDYELITRYMIKEEWIWDKQRSERYVRILGIAPMILDIKDGKERGFKPLFWLYYPHCRKLFSGDKAEVYNIFNDAQRRTFWDLFEKRYFSSYIVKEDNAFDRPIANYATGLSALAESERIQQELFNLEHDLWHY